MKLGCDRGRACVTKKQLTGDGPESAKGTGLESVTGDGSVSHFR